MNCPHCENSILTEIQAGTVLIDVCTGCRGAWFDPGELEPVATGSNLPEKLKSSPPPPDPNAKPWEGKPYSCPRCGGRLNRYWYAAEPSRTFLVNGCPQGHGVWLDGGQLALAQEVLRRFAAEGQAFAQSGRLDDALDRLEKQKLVLNLRREITAMLRAWVGR